MKTRWTLNVEGFGMIEKASIRVSPFMLFVGENNSGKSYMMSLLWGIFTLCHDLCERTTGTESYYLKCDEWLLKQQGKEEVEIDFEAQALFIGWFNELLDAHKQYLVRRLFNEKISIQKLSIDDFQFESVKVWFDLSPRAGFAFEKSFSLGYPLLSQMDQNQRQGVLQYICQKVLLGERFFNYQAPFLPASRTGFMLTYKSLTKNLVESGLSYGDRQVGKGGLKTSLPVTKFLSQLIELDVNEGIGTFDEVVQFIEREILRGSIKQDDSPIPNFLYEPNDSNRQLSLHVTSSLVSEVSPIVLFLKSGEPYDLIVIEEPEAHLHLYMQKKMANALVRLVNDKLPVWVTTHSDTILQQVNNMIKLFNNSNRVALSQKFGYEESDWLEPALATAYQFTVKNGKTIIEPLELTEYGFIVPTMNQTIADLTLEAHELQERDEDAD